MYIKIESSSNDFYKHLKKLQNAKYRAGCSQYLAEGSRAVYDAIKNGADVDAVVICEGFAFEGMSEGIKIYELSKRLFDEAKLTVNSQGILAVINYKMPSLASFDFSKDSHVLYLDSVSDPGNMGTILRSADAMGIDAVVCSRSCVDVFNPKVVRSSMASLLNVPIFMDEGDALKSFQSHGFDIVGTFPRAQILSCQYSYSPKTVIIMGNEANGISCEVEAMCTARLTIPMIGRAESLNVSTACAVMLYEMMLSKLDYKGE